MDVDDGDIHYKLEDKLANKLDLMINRVVRDKHKQDAWLQNHGKTGEGKCQPAGSKVLMANGLWKNIEDIREGDLILSPQHDGTNIPSKVTGLSSWYSNDNYDVIQLNKVNKKLYSCSSNHLIPVNKTIFPWKDGKRKAVNKFRTIVNYQAKDFIKLGWARKKDLTTLSSFKIDRYKDRSNCIIKPYTLGVFLGDGSFTYRKRKEGNSFNSKLIISSADNIVMDEVLKEYQIMNIIKSQGRNCLTYDFSLNGKLAKGLISLGLRGKGSGEKFIPAEALLSNSDYRSKLLAGLIDTDGYYYHGGYQFTLKSRRLIEDIKDLVYSLGGRTGEIREIKKKCQNGFVGTYYNITLYIGNCIIPLTLDRKKRKVKTFYLTSNRIAINLKKSEPCQVYGFSLDSPSKLYITDNWMITHNTNTSCVEAHYVKWKTGRDIHLFFKTSSLLAYAQKTEKKIIILDEPAFQSLSTDQLNAINKDFLRLINTARKKRHFVIVNFTKFWRFPQDIVVDTCLGMVHMNSKDGKDPGRFLYIRQKNLEKLWNAYKKSGLRLFSKLKSFGGRMPEIMEKSFEKLDITIEGKPHCTLKDYEELKDKAIESIGQAGGKVNRDLKKLMELRYRIGQLRIIERETLAAKLGISSNRLREWAKIDLNAPYSLEKEDLEPSPPTDNSISMAKDPKIDDDVSDGEEEEENEEESQPDDDSTI